LKKLLKAGAKIMEKPFTEYLTTAQALCTQKINIDAFLGIFDQQTDDGLTQELAELVKKLHTSYMESMLLMLFTTNTTKEIYRSKTIGIKKKIGSEKLHIAWGDLHSLLQSRAADALKNIVPKAC
jgi:hypothetical protein